MLRLQQFTFKRHVSDNLDDSILYWIKSQVDCMDDTTSNEEE